MGEHLPNRTTFPHLRKLTGISPPFRAIVPAFPRDLRNSFDPTNNLKLVPTWLLEAQQAPAVGTTDLRNSSWCYWENLRSERVRWYSGSSRINSMISESPRSAQHSLPRQYRSTIIPL